MPQEPLWRKWRFVVASLDVRMAGRTEFAPYSSKTILNEGKRADHCLWTHYSAYPHKSCQHRCHF
jgi:hypothetical protein